MKRFLGAAFVAAFVAVTGTARAEEKEAMAVIDKAIKAMGGEEQLAKAEMISWKSQGKMTFNDNTNDVKTQVTFPK